MTRKTHAAVLAAPAALPAGYAGIHSGIVDLLDAARQAAAVSGPFVSAPMPVRPEWADYNGHLNMAYYHVLFDTAHIDEAQVDELDLVVLDQLLNVFHGHRLQPRIDGYRRHSRPRANPMTLTSH